MNWDSTMRLLGLSLPEDDVEIDKAFAYLSLTSEAQQEIHLVSFGPLKVMLPADKPKQVFLDHSLLGEMFFNLFAGLSLKERNFKGALLERALKNNPSYLPTTESKGLDGTAKQVDYSVAVGDILVLAECKAVTRSFGIFGGQSSALQHRLKNVIHKGLNDVDAKITWFLSHLQGTNYDLRDLNTLLALLFPHFQNIFLRGMIFTG